MEQLDSFLGLFRDYVGVLSPYEQLTLLFCLEALIILLLLLLRAIGRERELPTADKRSAVPDVEGRQQEEALQKSPRSQELPDDGATVLSGLAKTRSSFFSKLASTFGAERGLGPEQYEQLEELLITSDLGVASSQQLLAALREESKGAELNLERLKHILQARVCEILQSTAPPEIVPQRRDGKPLVVMVVGVNGVGKTTTIGKLAFQFRAQGSRVLIAACDTFRAAAAEQLAVWAERSGAELIEGGEGAKPATVAYQAVHRAQDEQFDVLIIDTAGRLHTRVNLMNELENVVKIIEREQPGSPHETLLVVDATTGQNALQQAIDFNKRAALTGIVVTKLDGTPKGGIVVAIRNELGVPIRYVGVGESIADLRLFSAEEFSEALFSDEGLEDRLTVEDSAQTNAEEGADYKRVRRRRRTAD